MGLIITLGSKCKNFRFLRLKENYVIRLKTSVHQFLQKASLNWVTFLKLNIQLKIFNIFKR